MQRRLSDLTVKIGFPVLTGQFLFDWLSSDLRFAIAHLPLRAVLIFIVLLLGAAFREHRERNRRKVA